MEDETLINQTADVKKFHNPSHQFIPKFLKRIDKGKKTAEKKQGNTNTNKIATLAAISRHGRRRKTTNTVKTKTKPRKRRDEEEEDEKGEGSRTDLSSLLSLSLPPRIAPAIHFTSPRRAKKKKVSGRIAGSSGRPGRRGEEWDRVRGEPENQKNSRNILKRISGAEGGDFNKRHEEAAQCNKFSRGVFTERGM